MFTGESLHAEQKRQVARAGQVALELVFGSGCGSGSGSVVFGSGAPLPSELPGVF